MASRTWTRPTRWGTTLNTLMIKAMLSASSTLKRVEIVFADRVATKVRFRFNQVEEAIVGLRKYSALPTTFAPSRWPLWRLENQVFGSA